MNSPLQILDKKDPNFPSSNAGKRTIEWAKENNFKIKNREDIWRAYMARIESIFTDTFKDKNDIQNNTLVNNEGKVEGRKETKSERALRFMKYKIQKENTIDLENSEEVNKIATGLYESEKKIAVERGQGADIDQIGNVIDRYIENIKEKKEIQSESLTDWIKYITGKDCTLPTWFKYHAVLSLIAMGTKNIDKADYNKRAATTVSPYPEWNPEALGWVFNALTKGLEASEITKEVLKQKQEALENGLELTEVDKQKEADRVENIMSSDKFSKLFYFASMEVKGNLDRSYIEGGWIKYDKGSDYTLLEKGLKGKGTGWCTAEGSAKGQIESGDFYVYYSKNGKTGLYTEPRVAVRMNGDSEIGEVRGVNPSQELEPQFAEILDTKMNDFGEDEAKQYKKKSSDMKTLTQIYKKDEAGEELTKEELRFIYEIDSNIEGFGYNQDPRIKKLLEKRKGSKLQDYITIFNIIDEKEIEELKRKLWIDGLSLKNPSQVLEVASINPKEILKEKSSSDTKAGIYYWEGFKEKISPLLKESFTSETITYTTYELGRKMTGDDILKSLNISEDQIFTTAQLAQFIANQSEFVDDILIGSTPLLLNLYSLLPIKQVDGSIVLVGAGWGSGDRGWRLSARDLSGQWSAGFQVMVRN